MRSLEALNPTELFEMAYLPRKHFARACHSSESYIRKEIAEGRIPAVLDGDLVKIPITPRERLESLPRKPPAPVAERAAG